MNNPIQLPHCPVQLQPTVHPHNLLKYTPFPDTCDSGPVVGYPSNNPSNARSIDLVTRKHHTTPTLHPVGPCFTPCANGVAMRLRGTRELDEVKRHCHRGNLLQSLSFGEEHYLMQVINTDAGSTVKQFTLHNKQGRNLPQVTPVITYKKDDSLYDMQCNLINNEMMVLTRSLYTVDVHRVGDHCLDYVNNDPKIREMLTSANLNTEQPGFWLQSDVKQKIRFYDSHRKKSLWSCSLPDIACAIGPRWCTSMFGCRSYTGLAANRTSIYTADFRTRKFHSLFDAHTEKLNKFSDMICGVATLPDRPHFLCVLHNQLLLLDERNCRLPVLSWNHMLVDTPQRTVVFRDDHRDFVALSCSIEKKMCLVEIDNCSAAVETYEQYATASLIEHHNLFDPMQKFAHHRDLWFDDAVTKRLHQDITGFAWQKFPGCKVNIFVSNSCGDIFCQPFELRTEDMEDHSIDLKKEIVVHMKGYEESTCDLTVKNLFSDVDVFDVTHSLDTALNKISHSCTKNKVIKEEKLWNVSELVEQFRRDPGHLEALVDKRHLDWANILVDEYEIDFKHISRRAPAHVVNHYPVTEQFFSTAMNKRMKDKNLESCKDLLSGIILDHWPLKKSEESSDVTEIDGTKESKLDTYRAMPFSSLIAQGGLPSKYKRLSPPRSIRCKASSSKGSTAPTVFSDNASAVTSGSQGARSDSTSRANLKRLLAAATPTNLNTIPLSAVSSNMVPSSIATPRLLNLTPGISNSLRKKRKRNAGF